MEESFSVYVMEELLKKHTSMEIKVFKDLFDLKTNKITDTEYFITAKEYQIARAVLNTYQEVLLKVEAMLSDD